MQHKMFDIKAVLDMLPDPNDTKVFHEWGVRAMLYKSNQALLLTMPTGTSAFHLGDERLVNIEMLQGAVKVSCKETNYYPAAGTDVCAIFSIPSAYKITALTDCNLLLLARHPRPASAFPNEEEYRKWYKSFKRTLEMPEERLADF